MAVKKLTRDEYIKTLGFTPTDEQISQMPETFEIKVEDKELSWAEAQEKFKKELGSVKAQAIKDRFKGKTGDDDKEFDIEEVKAQAAKTATIATKISSFTSSNKIEGDDASDFETLVKSKIKAGKSVDEAIEAVKSKFVSTKVKKVQKLTDFGTPVVENDGQPVDEVERLLKIEAGIK